ncbi:DUF1802 family protein [Luteolibacter pohnpeiensis]|uniref:DUF1802 family protein n=1 Tax=Luteolibacter pohnpeiensis TaxID=454153 RepID=A0A934S616_9BACT|nr:DUF1802 family protein [Luteolibacter pohnpeiensis]MBK1881925.1 DUF1802 family protein [Luteolibacter pohnpeiensis]
MANPDGFKEWQVVCDALARGRQSILLRKGGIHEGRAGFSFAHESFFLFPTRFHALGDQVREGVVEVMPEWQAGDIIRITHHAKAVSAVTLTDWAQVQALEPFHIYSEKTVKDRFDWEGKGMTAGSIHVALVRVVKLAEAWEFAYEPKYGGCRSWLKMPEPPADWEASAEPVLLDAAFGELCAQLKL